MRNKDGTRKSLIDLLEEKKLVKYFLTHPKERKSAEMNLHWLRRRLHILNMEIACLREFFEMD